MNNRSIITISDNNIVELSEINNLKNKFINFDEVINLPNGLIETGDSKHIINKFLENKTDILEYRISVKVDHRNSKLDIHVLPIVESA